MLSCHTHKWSCFVVWSFYQYQSCGLTIYCSLYPHSLFPLRSFSIAVFLRIHHREPFSAPLTMPSWASDMIVVLVASEYLLSVCGSETGRWGIFPSGHSLGHVTVFLLNPWASIGTHSVVYLSSQACLYPSWLGNCDDPIGSSPVLPQSLRTTPYVFSPNRCNGAAHVGF